MQRVWLSIIVVGLITLVTALAAAIRMMVQIGEPIF
jgi:hypothetical protein